MTEWASGSKLERWQEKYDIYKCYHKGSFLFSLSLQHLFKADETSDMLDSLQLLLLN